MSDHVHLRPQSFAAAIDIASLRFVLTVEPSSEVTVMLSDLLAITGYPPAKHQQVCQSVLAAELRTVVVHGRATSVTQLGAARELVSRAAEYGYCPAYQVDVFEVLASYARDQLLLGDTSVGAEVLHPLSLEGEE